MVVSEVKMKKILENLWNQYFFEECAKIETEEEKILIKKANFLHEKANALMNQVQKNAIENYVGALHENESLLMQKAFFKGVRFAFSLLLETELPTK